MQFLESLFYTAYIHKPHQHNALTQCIKSAVLRQHPEALWQNCGIVTQHDSQTLWQNKNDRYRIYETSSFSHYKKG